MRRFFAEPPRHAPVQRALAALAARALPLVAALAAATPAGAAPEPARALPASVAAQRLPAPIQRGAIAPLHGGVRAAPGPQQVVVRLRTGAVAEIERSVLTEAARAQARRDRRHAIDDEQRGFIARQLGRKDARLLARVDHVLNAVFVEADAAAVARIAQDPAVARVAPVGLYHVDLAETVPYVGASAVQAAGFDGSGVRVAVLDSGIDYTHRNLGGTGTAEDYAAAFGTTLNDVRNQTVNPALFPTPKVVGGFDFVGERWPNPDPRCGTGPDGNPLVCLLPDPNPIACGGVEGCDGTHGTHVADITGGRSLDGTHVGVAPGSLLYALKVCSSVSTACSGIALIQAMEFAVDPDGDGDTRDHVDVINMSLGSIYGQPFDDDLSFAVDNATALGVLTVASAGNSADKPFVTGSPAAAPTALSVAQTAVPSAFLQFMELLSPAAIAGNVVAIFQSWSTPLAEVVEAPVQYGDGAGGNLNGCAPFAPGSLAGRIVLVDRGACNFTLKVKNVGVAGGRVGVIGLVAPGDPFEGGDGGDRPIDIPGYMISQADANRIRSGLAAGVTARFAPGVGLSLVQTVVGSSSRGPQLQDFRVKPEIGAPGASVSAVAGTGTGVAAFSGTSGAAPMVTGAAALLLQARGPLSPVEVKALLMNNAETNVLNGGGAPAAAVSRIGGGELRVDRALGAPAAAWDAGEPTASLGFGWVEASSAIQTLRRRVVVRNYSGSAVQYAISSGFRFAADATGAVKVRTPASIRVPAGQSRTFDVTLEIDSALLGGNFMHSGAGGANPALLTQNEFDGFVMLDDGAHPIHLPWHVIPRKAAALDATPGSLVFGKDGTAQTKLRNPGAGTAQIDVYSLLGLSGNLPEGAAGAGAPTPDLRAVGVQTFTTPAGFCGPNPGYLLALASSEWERQTHANAPGTVQWLLDTDRLANDPDCAGPAAGPLCRFEFAVFSFDLAGGTLGDGRNVTFAEDLATGVSSAFFFTEHATNTGNRVLLVCDTQIGSPPVGTLLDATVQALDIYFGGPGDEIAGLTFAPLGERYLPFDPATGAFFPPLDLDGGKLEQLNVKDFGAAGTNPSELGLFLVTNGDRGAGNRGGATQATEAVLLPARGPGVARR